MSRKNNSSEYIRLWRPPGVEGIELHSSRLFSHHYSKHFHDEYTIGINDAGLGSFWCRGANRIGGRNSLNLIAPGEVHTGGAASSEGWTYRGIYVSAFKVEEITRQLDWRPGSLPWFRQSIVIDDRLWRAMDGAFRILSSPHSRLESECTVLTSLCLLFDSFADPRPSADRFPGSGTGVGKVREYLEDRYCHEISLGELAAESKLSPYYLIRRFKKEFGLPPHAYQLQVRLQRAKADLKSGASLAGVSIKHGFFDQSHFHRHFKKAFGITPGRYAKAIPYKTDDATSSDS